LKNILFKKGLKIKITDDECEFLDSIYLPSKYPVSSVLPYYEPDLEMCNYCIAIAEKVFIFIQDILTFNV